MKSCAGVSALAGELGVPERKRLLHRHRHHTTEPSNEGHARLCRFLAQVYIVMRHRKCKRLLRIECRSPRSSLLIRETRDIDVATSIRKGVCKLIGYASARDPM